MSLWKISWRSIQQRGLASALTSLSMALGVMLVVAVLAILGVIQESFQTNASLGYHMIIGPKGSPLQLTLNTVYYLSSPVENIPYDYFLEFQPRERREAELADSLRAAGHVERTVLAELQAVTAMSHGGMGSALQALVTERALERAENRQLDARRDGKFAQYSKVAIPVCLGDYFGPFRVIATTPTMFDELKYGPRGDRKYEFSEGRNFKTHSDEHGYFEAVVGATVARERDVRIGSLISVSHGDPEGEGHGQKFTVVGILKQTGNPNDRGVFINIEGFYLMDDHAKPIEKDKEAAAAAVAAGQSADERLAAERAAKAAAHHEEEHGRHRRLPVEQREISAMLLLCSDHMVTPFLQNVINEGPVAQSVLPAKEIFTLFQLFVRPVQMLLLVLAALICLVSGVSILVSIYNSMSDRKHEIAVMRALGAGQMTVMNIILMESIILSLGGGLFGWLGGHGLIALVSDRIEEFTGVSIGFFDVAPPINILELLGIQSRMAVGISMELMLVPGLIILAVLVGLLPAISAYRTDVARSLGG